MRVLFFGALARTRTWNDGSEDRSDIHFTTSALTENLNLRTLRLYMHWKLFPVGGMYCTRIH